MMRWLCARHSNAALHNREYTMSNSFAELLK